MSRSRKALHVSSCETAMYSSALCAWSIEPGPMTTVGIRPDRPSASLRQRRLSGERGRLRQIFHVDARQLGGTTYLPRPLSFFRSAARRSGTVCWTGKYSARSHTAIARNHGLRARISRCLDWPGLGCSSWLPRTREALGVLSHALDTSARCAHFCSARL
jgi:hypothetical protein